MQDQMSELQWLQHITPMKQKIKEYQLAEDFKWINSRMEDSGVARCLAVIQREAQMEKDFQEKTDHAALVDDRARREIALAQAITDLRQKEICEIQRRHQIRQNDPELRNLIRSLHDGYTCRDLKQQMLHNEYKRLQEKAQDYKANDILMNSLMNDKEQLEYEEKLKNEKAAKYRLQIQQQMVNREQEKQCQYEDLLIEKKMLDEIMKTIYDEDMREIQQKRFLMARCRDEMDKTAAAQRAWKEKQKQLILQEEKELERQVHEKMEKDKSSSDEKAKLLKLREEANNRNAMSLLAKEKEQQLRRDFITELQHQEYLEKNHLDDIKDMETEERTKRETRVTLDAQVKMREKLAREGRQRDLQLRIQAEEAFREEEEREREKQRKKREIGRQYSRELMKQIEEKRTLKEANKRAEQARDKYVMDYQKKCDAETAIERKIIIEEHVPPILGYFKAGVITPEDIPAIKSGAARCPGMETVDMNRLETTKQALKYPKCNRQCSIIREY